MNWIDRSIGEWKSLEMLQDMDSPVHRLLPLAKLILTVFYLHSHIDHHLNAATIFRHYELFSLCVVLHYNRFLDFIATNSFR